MTKVYTRQGDSGSSTLSSGIRQKKSSHVFEVLGGLDEVQALFAELVDFAKTHKLPKVLLEQLSATQQDWFGIGAHVSKAKGWNDGGVNRCSVQEVERTIDLLETELPPLKNFIVPGGPPVVTRFHLARAVVRRLERQIVALSDSQPIAEYVLPYVNRISDLLFVASRTAAAKVKAKETIWNPPARK